MNHKDYPPPIAVFGCFSGGSSALAGVLHKMGVHTGDNHFVCADKKTGLTYEASDIRKIMKRFLSEQDPTKDTDRDSLRLMLRELRNQLSDPPEGFQACGRKNPHMCLCIEEIMEEWWPVTPIAILRPLDDIMKSLKRRGWTQGWRRSSAIYILDQITASIHEDYIINYDNMMANPSGTAQYIADHILSYTPTDKQMKTAIEFLRNHPNSRLPSSHEVDGPDRQQGEETPAHTSVSGNPEPDSGREDRTDHSGDPNKNPTPPDG